MNGLSGVDEWMEGRTDLQTKSRMDGEMDIYAVNSKFVVVHCTVVVCEKGTVRLRVFMAVSMKITIVRIYHRLR
jgi:hypothetical protein